MDDGIYQDHMQNPSVGLLVIILDPYLVGAVVKPS
jgi:hypothetical protein